MYSTLSCCIHTEMINLSYEASSAIKSIVCRKLDRVYRYWTTFSPSATNRYFMEDPSKDKDILCGLSLKYWHFSEGSSWHTEKLSRSWLLPELFFSLFLSFMQLILLTQTRQLRVLILLWRTVFVEDLVYS